MVKFTDCSFPRLIAVKVSSVAPIYARNRFMLSRYIFIYLIPETSQTARRFIRNVDDRNCNHNHTGSSSTYADDAEMSSSM